MRAAGEWALLKNPAISEISDAPWAHLKPWLGLTVLALWKICPPNLNVLPTSLFHGSNPAGESGLFILLLNVGGGLFQPSVFEFAVKRIGNLIE